MQQQIRARRGVNGTPGGFYFVSHVKPFNGHRMPCQRVLTASRTSFSAWDPPGNLCERLPFKINEALLDIGVRQSYTHAVANVEV